MTTLTRFTTEFSAEQDRIQLIGEDGTGGHRVLWLTQRLLNRLVSHLCKGLEQRLPDTAAGEIRRSFAQQAAAAALTPQAPVRPTGQPTEALVHIVNVSNTSATTILTFNGSKGEVLAQLVLAPTLLHQWLGILHGKYLQAGWPTTVWPNWLEEAQRGQRAQARSGALH